MATHAGERAEQSGRFWCEKCRESVRVEKGEVIPVCPTCGNHAYGSRTNEP